MLLLSSLVFGINQFQTNGLFLYPLKTIRHFVKISEFFHVLFELIWN